MFESKKIHRRAMLMNKTIRSLLCTLAITAFPSLVDSSHVIGQMRKTVEFLGLTAPLPDAWIEEQPSSSMRLARFLIPGGDNRGDAELVLYYFGQGQGGSAEANIARWKSQFTTASGGAANPSVETMAVSGMPVTVVELRGNYAHSVGMEPAATPEPDQILLATIVETPRGNVYIQLYGPAQAVAIQREAYIHFIRNITPLADQSSGR